MKQVVPVAGVDVSKHFSDMCILAPNNDVLGRMKIYHDLTSMERPPPSCGGWRRNAAPLL